MIARPEASAHGLMLVTGATGFTGSHLVRSLVADGLPVRVIARSAERARGILPDGVEIVEGDIADPGTIDRAMQGVDTVYHLAAVYREAKHPELRYREVNVEASRLLLHAFAEAVGRALPPPVHASAHRWRHALVETPVGLPCVVDEEIGAGACGDWCIAPRVEAAFESGRSLAHSILSMVGLSARVPRG